MLSEDEDDYDDDDDDDDVDDDDVDGMVRLFSDLTFFSSHADNLRG